MATRARTEYLSVMALVARYPFLSRDQLHKWVQRGKFAPADVRRVPGSSRSGTNLRLNVEAVQSIIARLHLS